MLGVPGERIRVVYPGVSPALVGSDAQCPRFPSTGPLLEPFFLHVGVLRRHKNPDNILAALARVTQETLTTHRLVCVGPYQVAPGLREALTATWRAAGGPEDRLIFLEGVGDAELGALYRQSSGLVFPSLHEGFGIPIAEALAVGTPVVASCFGASREAGGDLAIYVDPGDPTAIAEGCLRMARDDTHRERIRREGPAWVASRFTWSRASREVFDLYVQLSNGDCSSV
jgi:glycosyltransferase involved in cell wall biosynthesis